VHSNDTSAEYLHDGAPAAGSERRTRVVVAITAVMMLVELGAGAWTHSLALTADGWHMATHAGALGLAAFAYWYARRHGAADRFTFGTARVLALAGYSNAMVLLVIAAVMAYSAIDRFFHPETVQFVEACAIAVLGLVVNLVSAFLLGDHDEGEDSKHHQDHNLKAAAAHVAADALTSVLAICGLLAARYLGWQAADPFAAMVGSAVIAVWAIGLCRQSGAQLLDANADPTKVNALRTCIESMGDAKVVDIHLWRISARAQGCIVALKTSEPLPLADYRAAVRAIVSVEHLTIQVEQCSHVVS